MGYETVFWSITVTCLKGKKKLFWSIPCLLCLVQLRINLVAGREDKKDDSDWEKQQRDGQMAENAGMREVDKNLFQWKINSENWFDTILDIQIILSKSFDLI